MDVVFCFIPRFPRAHTHSIRRRRNTQKRLGHSRKERTLSKLTRLDLTLTYAPLLHSHFQVMSYLTKSAGLNCSPAAGRSLPRLIRNQGRQNTARRSPRSSYRYPNSFQLNFNGRLIPFTGRIAGQDGKTKFTIENASRTRIVLADTYVRSIIWN